MVDQIKLAHCQHDYATAETLAQNLIANYGVQSEERRRVIETLMKELIEYMIPVSYMYLMWAAQNDSGIFNAENLPGNEELEPGSKSEDEFDSIMDSVKLGELESTLIHKTKDQLKGSLKAITEKVKNFVEAKNQLCEEVKKLDSFVREQTLTKLNEGTVGGFYQWLDKV